MRKISVLLVLLVLLAACGEPSDSPVDGTWQASGWTCTAPDGLSACPVPAYFTPSPTAIMVHSGTVDWIRDGATAFSHDGSATTDDFGNECIHVGAAEEFGAMRSPYDLCYDAGRDAVVFGHLIEWGEGTADDCVCRSDFTRAQ